MGIITVPGENQLFQYLACGDNFRTSVVFPVSDIYRFLADSAGFDTPISLKICQLDQAV
jgi:hypothetical protein